MARKPKSKRPGATRLHVDDYRELVLDGTNATALPDALMALAQETRANRTRLLPEEAPRVRLAGPPPGARIEPQVEGTRAARELRRQMREAGIPEPTHYYTARERAEVGEVDRTYCLGRFTHRKKRRPR